MHYSQAGGGGPQGVEARAGSAKAGFRVLSLLDFGVGMPEPAGTPAQYAAVRHALAVWQVNTVVIATDPAAPRAAAGARPRLRGRLHDGGAGPPAHHPGRRLGLGRRPAGADTAPGAAGRHARPPAPRRPRGAAGVCRPPCRCADCVSRRRAARHPERPRVGYSSRRPRSADEEESGSAGSGSSAAARPIEALPAARARVDRRRRGRCGRDACGCAGPAGQRLPRAVVRRPDGSAGRASAGPAARRHRGPGRRLRRGPCGLPAAARPDGVRARRPAAAGAYGAHPVRLLRPRRLHRHDPGHGPVGGRPAAVRGHGDRRRHRRAATSTRSSRCSPRRGRAGHAGLRQLAGAVALPHRRPAAPGGGARAWAAGRSPTTCSTGTGCTSASRPGTQHLTADLQTRHRHLPLVWCQSGAVHHALRRPQ